MAVRKLTTPSNNIQRGSAACALRAYCRVSTDQRRGTGISLDEQQRKIEGPCIENGCTLQRVYIDAGISGSMSLGWRPEDARLPAAVKASEVVVAAKLDRMCGSVMKVRHEMRSRGDRVSHNLVANTLQRRAEP